MNQLLQLLQQHMQWLYMVVWFYMQIIALLFNVVDFYLSS